MKTKHTFLLFVVFLIGLNSYAQFNDYKYIIVPKKFDGFRKENMHNTSTIVKYLLTKKGFNTVYDDALPEDLFSDRCLGLTVDLEDNSSFISTKTALVFKDCRSQEVFRTVEGRSKLKEFKPAYSQAINGAFVSLNGIKYAYETKEEMKKKSSDEPIILNFKNDVKTLDEKPKEVVLEQKATPDDQTYKALKPKSMPVQKSENTSSAIKKSKEVVLEQKATPEEQVYKQVTPKPALFKTDDISSSEVLYAQPIPNGFQLVDSSPKIRYKLVETSIKEIYLVSEGDAVGVVLQKDGTWYLEYVENGLKKSKALNIKF